MLKIQHVLPFLLPLTGCAVRQPFPATWRLAGRTLIPPGVTAELAQRTFAVPIRGRSPCPASDAITVQPRGSGVRVTVRRDALAVQPRGWLTTWGEQAESQGCLAPGQGSVLAARIVESIALQTGADLRLLRVDGMPNYVEVGAGTLQLAGVYNDSQTSGWGVKNGTILLNKAPGVVVHPSAGHEEHTMVNALLHHCAGRLSGIGGVVRPGIVHRRDKDTSGCLLVAKSDAAHLALAEQFAGRTMEKIYHAIVCGEVPNDAGEIHAAVARHPSHRKRMAVTDGRGREAWTSYRVLERLRGATLVEASLHTGRTHQIRVHFQHLGFPVAGDTVYGKRPNARLAELTGHLAPRQMLHARRLGFTHPITGKKVVFEAPWPEDFKAALEAWRGIC